MPPAKPAPPANQPAEAKTPINPDCQLLCVRFSPCGKVLAAGGCDGSVRRWDVSADAPVELPKLAGHNGWVGSVAFHPDKTRLFASDSWGRVSCWDYTAKEPKRLWDVETAHAGWARKLALSPDGKTLASVGRDGFARLWDAATGKKAAEFAAGEDLLAVAFHPTAPTLATGGLSGTISKWELGTGKKAGTFEVKDMYLLHRIQDVGGVRCLTFSADGKTLFAGGAKPSTGGFVQAVPLIASFDYASGKPGPGWKGAADSEGYVHDLLPHPAGHLVAVTSGQPGNGKVFFWKPGDAQPSFTAAKANCHSAALTADGKRLAVSATNANSSGNGKVKGKGGDYPANFSPVFLWTLPV